MADGHMRNKHPIQAMCDGWAQGWKEQRAETQMTLGKLIDALRGLPVDAQVQKIEFPHSYRGYYTDLAFQSAEGTMSVAEALAVAQSAMGQTFEGYKGGEYDMSSRTPVWIADYGSSGKRIMAIGNDGTFVLAEED